MRLPACSGTGSPAPRAQENLTPSLRRDSDVSSKWPIGQTVIQLEEFREANPRLPGLNKAPLNTGHDQVPQALPVAAHAEELKAITRDLRNAANASLQAALEAARLAEESARSHRVQLEQIAQTVAALDAALGNLTAPSTMND